MKKNIFYYSYFKRFSPHSIGGTITGISRKAARQLITRYKGKIKPDHYDRVKAERVIQLNNNNHITIYIGEL